MTQEEEDLGMKSTDCKFSNPNGGGISMRRISLTTFKGRKDERALAAASREVVAARVIVRRRMFGRISATPRIPRASVCFP